MDGFKKVAKLDDIPENGMKSFEIDFEKIIICRTEDGVYALTDECSHDSAPISLGHIENCQVVCPRHGARFDIKSGDVKAPPAVVGIDTYEVKIDGDDIYVKLD